MHSTTKSTIRANTGTKLDMRKKPVQLLVRLLAKRLSPAERGEVLREWELLCVLNGYDDGKADGVVTDHSSLS